MAAPARSWWAVAAVVSLAVGVFPAAAEAPTCGGRAATIIGTTGSDTLTGTDGDDVIVGLEGNDRIDGMGGDDTICGGAGNDHLDGGAGDDALDGEAGSDTASFATADGVSVDLGAGWAVGAGRDRLLGIENVRGSRRDDVITGDGGRNKLIGLGGDDVLLGLAGNDVLKGGGGADALVGGPGWDTARGGAGRDECPTSERTTSCEVVATGIPPYSDPVAIMTLGGLQGDMTHVESADLNGDGHDDVVITRRVGFTGRRSPIGVLAGDGRGGLTDVTDTIFRGPVPEVVNPREIVFADFNGDGRTDIFFADEGFDADPYPGARNTLVLSFGADRLVDASGGIPSEQGSTHSAAAGDVDGDGDVDLYVGNVWGQGSEPPRIWLNDGEGGFTAAPGLLPYPLEDMDFGAYTTSEFADIDHDGDDDLILGNASRGLAGGPESVVLRNDGSGGFTRIPGAIPLGRYGEDYDALDIDAADLDGDGDQDLLMVYTRQSYQGRFIQVLINRGNGTFRDETTERMPQSENTDPWIMFVHLVDLDRDFSPDVVAEVVGASEPLFWMNDGNGSFTEQPNVFNIGTDLLFTFLDLNGDRYQDAVWSYSGCSGGSCWETHQVVLARP